MPYLNHKYRKGNPHYRCPDDLKITTTMFGTLQHTRCWDYILILEVAAMGLLVEKN